ncbi:hypothetical protein AXF42_Ash017784 [Apostasia shenzhenica]|uniref:Uncharacterized protein n=1 Tax=Apostasia shenzhenica TaxID=1088818 RepID=A0A2I0B6A5_9ASPA|nr:hypothetical protein AXF42_Ash017784 [Apostasia shenzhenica]
MLGVVTKTCVWHATDFSVGELKDETFSLYKSPIAAHGFADFQVRLSTFAIFLKV